MIVQLTGKLASKLPDHCIVDVSGVGYGVQLSLATFSALPEIGEVLKLEIYTHVREDQLNLFGFASPEEKDLFKKLISISGVGPKMALGILSGLPTTQLVKAIGSEDRDRLTKIPGVGKKTAERIIIELKDKISIDHSIITSTPGSELIANRLDGAISALVNLGYKQQTAEDCLKKLKPSEAAPIEEIIRLALKELCRS
jgi:holliday junction DNA helicase RuvA